MSNPINLVEHQPYRKTAVPFNSLEAGKAFTWGDCYEIYYKGTGTSSLKITRDGLVTETWAKSPETDVFPVELRIKWAFIFEPNE